MAKKIDELKRGQQVIDNGIDEQQEIIDAKTTEIESLSRTKSEREAFDMDAHVTATINNQVIEKTVALEEARSSKESQADSINSLKIRIEETKTQRDGTPAGQARSALNQLWGQL